MMAPGYLRISSFANMHSIFNFSLENAKIEDCLADNAV